MGLSSRGDACCNTIEITDSSHVVIRNLTVDGKGIDGVFGVSAKGSVANHVHHITIEGCTFVGQSASQQTVAISTKTPTSGWVIRRNVILGAGTGLYLGNSNHEEPFAGGLIEYNLVLGTIGYAMQIKDQSPWPVHPSLPRGDARTIIRHNVFIKDDQASPDGARPNVYVGSPPPSGTGAFSSVEVYGNLFAYNHQNEALLQATGRISVHDNIFVDASDAALSLQAHDGFPLLRAHVYNNTMYGVKRGIVFGTTAVDGDIITGNLIFADSPLEGPVTVELDNLTAAIAEAPSFVLSPGVALGSVDLYPLQGKAQGAPLGLAAFAEDAASLCDFNGSSKSEGTFRGAYAGAGVNPGWKLAAAIKAPVVDCSGAGGAGPSGGGGDGGAGSSAGGAGGTATTGSGDAGGASARGDDAARGAAEDSGCGCRTAASADHGASWCAALLGAAVARRRRRERSPVSPRRRHVVCAAR